MHFDSSKERESYCRAAVKEAAEGLDQDAPGWAGRIDPSILDLMDAGSCILGQTFRESDTWSGFGWALEDGNAPRSREVWYKFCEDGPSPFADDECIPYWEEEIKSRLGFEGRHGLQEVGQ